MVRCVECPLVKGYISVPNCYKCPNFINHSGLTINCGYKPKRVYVAESDTDKEYSKSW